MDSLITNDLWWRGPSFLNIPNAQWEHDNINSSNIHHDVLPELKTNKTALLVQIKSDSFLFDRFSRFNRLRRVVAYIMRFVNNSRTKLKPQRLTGCLSMDELNISVRVLTRVAQQQAFPNVYDTLKHNRQVTSPHSISSLNVSLGEHDLIRVGGRLSYSDKFSILKCSVAETRTGISDR